jgi:hypothetical protein
MAGKGMGAATKGGGCIESGPRNKMLSTPNKKNSGPVMMSKGGEVEETGVMGTIKGVGKGMMDVVTEGASKVRDDVERVVGTERGKRLNRESEEKSRKGIDLVKAYERMRQKEEASRYAKGGEASKGAINQHKRMAMGKKVTGTGKAKKMMGGGMIKGYSKGGAC